ncbi:MAG: DNA-binding domain-containing protein [Candidatus Dadabacteria bacterium CSP1-2]|nr:MAG: DNA-binding domain-containing protein [Candidatus Dadabacteria bacterium CSP1-2]
MGSEEIKIPEELLEELDKIAKEASKSKSFHIKRAIKAYLEEYYYLKIALARLKDKNDRLITDEELRKALGL